MLTDATRICWHLWFLCFGSAPQLVLVIFCVDVTQVDMQERKQKGSVCVCGGGGGALRLVQETWIKECSFSSMVSFSSFLLGVVKYAIYKPSGVWKSSHKEDKVTHLADNSIQHKIRIKSQKLTIQSMWAAAYYTKH